MNEQRLTDEQILAIMDRHTDEILALREELKNGNDMTPRHAVEEWLCRQAVEAWFRRQAKPLVQ